MTPDVPRMSDDEFRQLVMRTLAEHETRLAAHEATMAKMDRQYEKLLEVQRDLARSHDEHDGTMDQLRRMQARLERNHADHADRMSALQHMQRLQHQTMEQLQLTLDAITELLRDRRH